MLCENIRVYFMEVYLCSILVYFVKVYLCTLLKSTLLYFFNYTLYFESILLICTCESVLSHFESILVYFVRVYLCTL